MADAQAEAFTALLEGITRVTGEISEWTEDKQASILRDLAAAFRYTIGGQQPGS